MKGRHFIDQEWVEGGRRSPPFSSINPATEEVVWQGNAAREEEIENAVNAAKKASIFWRDFSLEKRTACLLQFQSMLEQKKHELAEIISKEIGKPLWESQSEVGAILNKVSISIEAYQDRCRQMLSKTSDITSIVRHKPHGVVAVFGAFNFPGHLPSGHIIPALLAGNTVVFKPSELAPMTAELLTECWEKTSLPKGVFNLIQGDGKTGEMLANHNDINGLFFTGSYRVGSSLSNSFGKTPEKILALEMGGNNPLVVHDLPHHSEQIMAAVYHTLQSAFMTSGQRCTCARRLIVTRQANSEHFVEQLINSTERLKVGAYTEHPEPFLGPVVSKKAAEQIYNHYQNLLKKGGRALVAMQNNPKHSAFLTPALVDVTEIDNREDEEIFGPLLQLIWVEDFEQALKEANNTRYGLSAGLFSENEANHHQFLKTINAGVINWNRPLTGASSHAPFGGIGRSGNHRPSAYYAADYCAYPVSSLEETHLSLPQVLLPGVSLFDQDF